MKEKIEIDEIEIDVEIDEMLNIVDGVVKEDRTDKDLKKDYPDKVWN